ncbi:RNA polymerase II C-terminal domain phosphatase-like 3 [Bidens hawaiensis]|uniref:RNA polymerase II C-terminal domain phosphatase-like 3 n=1 Tax=Bidens hawaiensis TaxID=980011 RepID=UPI0040497F7D
MSDLVLYPNTYQLARNYAPELYNFAWAQAVQNKPLDDYLTVTNTGTGTDNNADDIKLERLDNKIVVDLSDDDSEKEDGELEEGEIVGKEVESMIEKWIDVIRVGLEGITLNGANKSFNGVCTRLEDMLDSLSTLLSENAVSNKDDLVRLAFSAIQLVNSVFCSMNKSQQELSRHIISRMLSNVKSHVSVMFSPEPLKELENMLLLCNSTDACSSTKADDKEKDLPNRVDQEVASVNEESVLDAMTIASLHQNSKQSESLRTQTSTTKNRVLLPLLDLHKDHDIDSLPSPTQETANALPLTKVLVGDAEIRPEWPTPTLCAVPHRYETDALKAVSTYQQKFSQSSFMSHDLPSPTPSEESDDASGDCTVEVSSIPDVQNSNSLASEARPNVQLHANVVYSTTSSVTRYSNKIRDPRLRLANPASSLEVNQVKIPLTSKQPAIQPLDGLLGSRKQKTFDKPVLVDGPATKRLKIDFLDSGDSRNIMTLPQTRGLENVLTTTALPGTGVNRTSASMQSVIKGTTVNPTQRMNSVSKEQHKSVDPANHVTQINQGSVLGSTSMTTSVSQSLMVGERSTCEMQKSHTSSMDHPVKLRMKPRDPRRALHSKSLRKQEPTTNLATAVGKKGILKQTDPRTPDITRQSTKNMKNVADIVSTTPSASVQMPTSQVHSSFVNIKGSSSHLGRVQNGTGPGPEEVTPDLGPSQSHNAWGDVEQLFGRFDDEERAAIQRERSRRMEEQKKMFADRKLCLVLDLDHTLLNSAKFSEIDPVHDEMLRRKEEQDRDKPHRHLFRFTHMGMWTKLWPGVWNFLRKASKLYELHLYTMGNKVYAKEMAKLLDPKGVLFKGRVISRGDSGDNVDGDPKIKDLDGVLGMESAVVIIDDSIRVWPHNKLNLIVVERYIFFPCSRRQFGLSGPSLLEIDHDERPEDGSLASSLVVIEKIHKLFFMEKSLDEADARNILASEQRKILGGCRILFSRVIPMGDASPHLHPLWQTAEQFGAVCTNQIDDQVTHVVANSLGTDKVNWALATGRPVVYPGWLEASALLYRRANEHNFAVKP